ncbi:MAG: FAD-dependent oxidoreductase, partial [Colwellia sp.]|nr:FAD-dependent oxidoreductase [Colwellia sp.]
ADIVSTFSGVRPVISADKHYKKNNKQKAPSKERRDHTIWAEKGLVTASGGKLTTFRLTAVEAIAAATPWLKVKPRDQKEAEFINNIELSKANQPKPWLKRLTGRYGANAELILQQVNGKSLQIDEQEMIASTQFCLAECRWALKHEAVVHLDDLLLRRTRLGLLLRNGAAELFSLIETICQQELGWDKVKWQNELSRYQAIIRQHYALPK